MIRFAILIGLVSVVVTGCRVNPRAEREIALLRAEILDLEDQYYSLKSRCGADGIESGYGYTIDDGFNYCDDCEPNTEVYYGNDRPTGSGIDNEPAPSVMEELEPMIDDVETGDETSRLRIIPSPDVRTHSVALDRTRDSKVPNSRSVRSLVINREFSQGENIDGRPGDEGVTLLLQPINNRGNIRKVGGAVTIRMVESESNMISKQIGKWEFSASEIESFIVRDETAEQGILLHLPWDKLRPSSQKINVFVRYTTSDNRNLDASTQLEIEPPSNNYSADDPLVASWIENDSRWISVSTEAIEFDELESETADNGERVSTPRWRPVR